MKLAHLQVNKTRRPKKTLSYVSPPPFNLVPTRKSRVAAARACWGEKKRSDPISETLSMIFFLHSAEPALVPQRPTACGSILMFATVFIKYRKLGREEDPRRGDATPPSLPAPSWSSFNSATVLRKLNITKQ